MKTGLSKILRTLQNTYFNLVATISEFLYTCRQGIVRLHSTLLFAAQIAVRIWKAQRSTLTQMYSEAVRIAKSSSILKAIWSLILLFGSMALKIIQTGFTFLLFAMVIIAKGVSKLYAAVKAKVQSTK